MKISVWILCFVLVPVPALASVSQDLTIPGRLFYSPTQRAMLNDARVRKQTDSPNTSAAAPSLLAPAPVSFDGVITRSDGVATHWVNGRPHVGRSSDKVHNLKPGQTRAAQKVYESYQIHQPDTASITPSASASSPLKPSRHEDRAP